MIFDYPSPEPERTHGPAGYSSYESFRPWLRDEFVFRCVYCLKRETWGQVTSEFEIDHFEAQSIKPQRRLDYQNLVYACRRCNAVKLDHRSNDPWSLLRSPEIRILADGSADSRSPDVTRLILQLDLNSPRMKEWRITFMRIVELAAKHDLELYQKLTGFPKELPDLSKLRPPRNSRTDGISQSWFMRRERGELPPEY